MSDQAESDESEPSEPRTQRTLMWLCAGVAVVLAVLFGTRLDGAFISDDVFLVQRNPALLEPGGLARIWTMDLFGAAGAPAGNAYRPLHMTTLWAQVRLGAESITRFRLFNLVLHAAVVLSLVGAVRRCGVRPWLAVVAGALFGMHPLSVEPVMWLSARAEPLGVLLVAGAMAAALSDRPRPQRALLVFASCAAASLCKEPFLLAPLWLAIVHAAKGEARSRRVATSVGAATLASIAVLGLRAAVAISSGSNQLAASPVENVRHLGSIIGHYGFQMFSFSNGGLAHHYQSWSWVPAACALAVPALAIAAMLRVRERHPRIGYAGAALSLSVVALAPLVMAIPVTERWADRYAYWALAPAMAAVAFLLEAALRWRPRAQIPAMALMALVTVGVGLLSNQQVAAWESPLRLYELDVARRPTDSRALYHLGHAVRLEAGCPKALPIFRAAFHADPTYARAAHNIAGCLINTGRHAEALAPARATTELAPNNPRHHYNLGIALAASGKRDDAVAALRRALELDPNYEAARRTLSAIEREAER